MTIDLKEIKRWQNDFEHALTQDTSGSQGCMLTKTLFENMSQFEYLDEFKAVEDLADGLCILGTISTPPVFIRLIRSACLILIERLYTEANFEDARMREEAWYESNSARDT